MVGIAVPFLPTLSFVDLTGTGWLRHAADEVRNGSIGSIRQVQLIHTYHPEVTQSGALSTLIKQDFEVAGTLAGAPLTAVETVLFKESPSSRFGSYAARYQSGTIQVIWQGLARYGGAPTPPSRLIRLIGSKGILHKSGDGAGYQIHHFPGRAFC